MCLLSPCENLPVCMLLNKTQLTRVQNRTREFSNYAIRKCHHLWGHLYAVPFPMAACSHASPQHGSASSISPHCLLIIIIAAGNLQGLNWDYIKRPQEQSFSRNENQPQLGHNSIGQVMWLLAPAQHIYTFHLDDEQSRYANAASWCNVWYLFQHKKYSLWKSHTW